MDFFKNFSDSQNALLKVIIAFDDDDNATVEFEKLNPEIRNDEYIRLVLHYYAKILFNFDPNQPEANQAYDLLLTATEEISEANLSDSPNILEIADIDDVVTLLENPIEQKHRFVGTLFAGLGVERFVKTKIPIKGYLQHMAFTVPILIQGVVHSLNINEIEILQISLKLMNEQYRSGVDFRKFKNLVSVPTKAYILASKRIL